MIVNESLMRKIRESDEEYPSYKMAYMEMDINKKNLVMMFLFFMNILMGLLITNLSSLVNILGSTTMPFMIYVLPGMVYY